MQPATKITLSNVRPFISDEFLMKELRCCQSVVLSSCKSPRRQLCMILNNKDEVFDYRFRVRVDGFEYILFATSSTVKCFGCGEEGHLIKACPSRSALAEGAAVPAAATEPTAPGRRWPTRSGGVASGGVGAAEEIAGTAEKQQAEEIQRQAVGSTEVSGEREDGGCETGEVAGDTVGEVVNEVGETVEGSETGEVVSEMGEENKVVSVLEEAGEAEGEAGKTTGEVCEKSEVAVDQCKNK